LTAVVVLPTPPLIFVTAMIFTWRAQLMPPIRTEERDEVKPIPGPAARLFDPSRSFVSIMTKIPLAEPDESAVDRNV
jgi:hypothetical protein